jgi:hypothetical protein
VPLAQTFKASPADPFVSQLRKNVNFEVQSAFLAGEKLLFPSATDFSFTKLPPVVSFHRAGGGMIVCPESRFAVATLSMSEKPSIVPLLPKLRVQL